MTKLTRLESDRLELRAALENAEFLLRKLTIHPNDVLAMRDSIRAAHQYASRTLEKTK